MRKLATLTAAVVFAAFGLVGMANAEGGLPAPTALSCNLPGDYVVAWTAIAADAADFDKYAVSIECFTPDTDGDGDEANIFEGVFDTGTSDCFFAATAEESEEGIDGVLCTGLLATSISIDPALIEDAGGFNPPAGAMCTVTVKGVHKGKGRGRQDSTNHAEASVGCPNFPVL